MVISTPLSAGETATNSYGTTLPLTNGGTVLHELRSNRQVSKKVKLT